jgi:hypothetical protein
MMVVIDHLCLFVCRHILRCLKWISSTEEVSQELASAARLPNMIVR